MIQRPQSVFLLIAALAAVFITMVPLWQGEATSATPYPLLNAWCLQVLNPQNELIQSTYMPYTLIGILTLTVALGAVYAIFQYKARMWQVTICQCNIALLVTLVGLLTYLIMQHATGPWTVTWRVCWRGYLLLAITAMNHLLAIYFIRKDEKLVRDAERIR